MKRLRESEAFFLSMWVKIIQKRMAVKYFYFFGKICNKLCLSNVILMKAV